MKRRLLLAMTALVALGGLGQASGRQAGDIPLPFFDFQDSGPLDPTPEPPGMSEFDAAILDLCGTWDAPVRKAAFLRVVDVFPAVQARLTASAGGNLEAFADRWFRREGFKHVLCGDPGRSKLGGLHWAPRYLQGQEKGWISRLVSCRRTEIKPPVYTVGVRFLRENGAGDQGEKCPSGYALGLSAMDMLVAGAAVQATGTGRQVCLTRVRSIPLVAVIDDGALVTLYPDATPDRGLARCPGRAGG